MKFCLVFQTAHLASLRDGNIAWCETVLSNSLGSCFKRKGFIFHSVYYLALCWIMVVSDLFPLGCYSEAFLAATKPQLPQTSLPLS